MGLRGPAEVKFHRIIFLAAAKVWRSRELKGAARSVLLPLSLEGSTSLHD